MSVVMIVVMMLMAGHIDYVLALIVAAGAAYGMRLLNFMTIRAMRNPGGF
jgi:hypothetical protein